MQDRLFAADPTFLIAYLDRIENATEDDKKRAHELFASEIVKGEAAVDKIYSVEGSRAIIRISGPLSMAGPDELDLYYGYGGVSYPAIIAAFERAAADPSLIEVEALANTPGGEVNGADITFQALSSLCSKKTVKTRVSGMLASAGYYILCPSHEIKASAPTDFIGSIGVVIAGYDFSPAYEKMGIKKYAIVSKNAPNKAAGPETEKGRSVLQDRVDAVERIFYQRISEARKVSAEFIAANFGQGSLLVAKDPDPKKNDAIRSKMIDSLVSEMGDLSIQNSREPAAAGESSHQEVQPMNLSEFMAQGPGAAAEIEKIKADAVAPTNARIAKCAAILGAEKYASSAIVRSKAIACMKGEISIDALDGVVGTFDMLAEKENLEHADDETEGLGDTTAKGGAHDAAAEAAEITSLAELIAGKTKKEVK